MLRQFGLAALVVAGFCAGCTNRKPAPVAQSAPPAVPTQNFDIFFPGDSTEITAEGQAVVAKIADTAKSTNPKRITVTGEDDGGTAHDAEIAAERGEHVANALITAGLAPATVVQVPGAPPASATSIAAHKVVVKFES